MDERLSVTSRRASRWMQKQAVPLDENEPKQLRDELDLGAKASAKRKLPPLCWVVTAHRATGLQDCAYINKMDPYMQATLVLAHSTGVNRQFQELSYLPPVAEVLGRIQPHPEGGEEPNWDMLGTNANAIVLMIPPPGKNKGYLRATELVVKVFDDSQGDHGMETESFDTLIAEATIDFRAVEQDCDFGRGHRAWYPLEPQGMLELTIHAMRPLANENSLQVNMRVQRGPYWQFGSQDGGMIKMIGRQKTAAAPNDFTFGPFQCGTVTRVRRRPDESKKLGSNDGAKDTEDPKELVDVVVKWDANGLKAFYPLEMLATVREKLKEEMTHEEQMQSHVAEMAAKMVLTKKKMAKRLKELRSRSERLLEKKRSMISRKRRDDLAAAARRRGYMLFRRYWDSRSMGYLFDAFCVWFDAVRAEEASDEEEESFFSLDSISKMVNDETKEYGDEDDEDETFFSMKRISRISTAFGDALAEVGDSKKEVLKKDSEGKRRQSVSSGMEIEGTLQVKVKGMVDTWPDTCCCYDMQRRIFFYEGHESGTRKLRSCCWVDVPDRPGKMPFRFDLVQIGGSSRVELAASDEEEKVKWTAVMVSEMDERARISKEVQERDLLEAAERERQIYDPERFVYGALPKGSMVFINIYQYHTDSINERLRAAKAKGADGFSTEEISKDPDDNSELNRTVEQGLMEELDAGMDAMIGTTKTMLEGLEHDLDAGIDALAVLVDDEPMVLVRASLQNVPPFDEDAIATADSIAVEPEEVGDENSSGHASTSLFTYRYSWPSSQAEVSIPCDEDGIHSLALDIFVDKSHEETMMESVLSPLSLTVSSPTKGVGGGDEDDEDEVFDFVRRVSDSFGGMLSAAGADGSPEASTADRVETTKSYAAGGDQGCGARIGSWKCRLRQRKQSDDDSGEKEREECDLVTDGRKRWFPLDVDGRLLASVLVCVPVTASIVRLGLRVERGVHWRSGDQDGGKGALGTVVGFKIGAEDEATGSYPKNLPPLHSVVKWDLPPAGTEDTETTGARAFYAIGYVPKQNPESSFAPRPLYQLAIPERKFGERPGGPTDEEALSAATVALEQQLLHETRKATGELEQVGEKLHEALHANMKDVVDEERKKKQEEKEEKTKAEEEERQWLKEKEDEAKAKRDEISGDKPPRRDTILGALLGDEIDALLSSQAGDEEREAGDEEDSLASTLLRRVSNGFAEGFSDMLSAAALSTEEGSDSDGGSNWSDSDDDGAKVAFASTSDPIKSAVATSQNNGTDNHQTTKADDDDEWDEFDSLPVAPVTNWNEAHQQQEKINAASLEAENTANDTNAQKAIDAERAIGSAVLVGMAEEDKGEQERNGQELREQFAEEMRRSREEAVHELEALAAEKIRLRLESAAKVQQKEAVWAAEKAELSNKMESMLAKSMEQAEKRMETIASQIEAKDQELERESELRRVEEEKAKEALAAERASAQAAQEEASNALQALAEKEKQWELEKADLETRNRFEFETKEIEAEAERAKLEASKLVEKERQWQVEKSELETSKAELEVRKAELEESNVRELQAQRAQMAAELQASKEAAEQDRSRMKAQREVMEGLAAAAERDAQRKLEEAEEDAEDDARRIMESIRLTAAQNATLLNSALLETFGDIDDELAMFISRDEDMEWDMETPPDTPPGEEELAVDLANEQAELEAKEKAAREAAGEQMEEKVKEQAIKDAEEREMEEAEDHAWKNAQEQPPPKTAAALSFIRPTPSAEERRAQEARSKGRRGARDLSREIAACNATTASHGGIDVMDAGGWTESQEMALVRAVEETPSDLPKQQRWKKISNSVEGHGKKDCEKRYKQWAKRKKQASREDSAGTAMNFLRGLGGMFGSQPVPTSPGTEIDDGNGSTSTNEVKDDETPKQETGEEQRKQDAAVEQAKQKAKEKSKQGAEEKAKTLLGEAKQKAKEETQRKQAEDLARKAASAAAQTKGEAAARKAAEEKARKDAEEEQRMKDVIEQARRTAKEDARQEAEEAARKAEEAARKDTEEMAKKEVEKKAQTEVMEQQQKSAAEQAAQITGTIDVMDADGWTESQEITLVRAVEETPSDLPKQQRWKKISNSVEGHGKKDCEKRYKQWLKRAKKKKQTAVVTSGRRTPGEEDDMSVWDSAYGGF
jgi:hypothetical protein